jgi:uncharacterized protein YpmB
MLITFVVIYLVCVIVYKYFADKLVSFREEKLDEATSREALHQARGT